MELILGPLVRLEGITVSHLPYGGKGNEPSNRNSSEKFNDGSGSAAPPNLKKFVTNILSESIPFIDGVAPKSGGSSTWKGKGSPKSFPSSEAPVQLYEKVIPGKELDQIEGMNQFAADRKDETWFCRRSCHNNKAVRGTASWQEFVHSFKEHHAETEDAFTPTVIGAREAIKWNTSGIEVEVHGGQWNNITLIVEEMKHRIDPKPLKNRTFPVLQLTASLSGTKEFIVVSIPITDFEKSPYAEYVREKSLVVAAYASVERIRALPNNGDIEWIMATASNAGGVLPQWVQNLAVPGAIAKDVEMFLGWIPSQRDDQSAPTRKSTTSNKSLPTAPNSFKTEPPPPISKILQKPRMSREDSAKKALPADPRR